MAEVGGLAVVGVLGVLVSRMWSVVRIVRDALGSCVGYGVASVVLARRRRRRRAVFDDSEVVNRCAGGYVMCSCWYRGCEPAQRTNRLQRVCLP